MLSDSRVMRTVVLVYEHHVSCNANNENLAEGEQSVKIWVDNNVITDTETDLWDAKTEPVVPENSITFYFVPVYLKLSKAEAT